MMQERVLEEREQGKEFNLFLQMALEGAGFSGEGAALGSSEAARPVEKNLSEEFGADPRLVELLRCKVCREPVPTDLENRIRQRVSELA